MLTRPNQGYPQGTPPIVGPFGGSPTLGTGLLFCYECDDNAANSTVVDAHTNNYDGTYKYDNGFAWSTRNTSTDSIVGKLDNAFAGTTVGVNNCSGVDFTAVEGGVPGSIYAPGNDFSWSMWVRWPTNAHAGGPNSRSTYDSIIGNWAAVGVKLSVEWYDIGGGNWRVKFVTYDGSFRGVYSSTDCSAFDDAFFHICVTYDASAAATNLEDGAKVYINGSDVTVKIGVGGKPASFTSGDLYYNGRADANYPGRCDMDQFAGWTKALTPTEANWMYNGGTGYRYSD